MTELDKDLEEIKVFASYHLDCIQWPNTVPTKHYSFAKEINESIVSQFPELRSGDFSGPIDGFKKLRNAALSCYLSDAEARSEGTLNNLRRYYCQLASMINRFKDCKAEFGWVDAFGRKEYTGNLEFEINNVMYNIAACHNELAVKTPRESELQIKASCQHFRSALWWLTELRDNRTGQKTKEMSADILTLYFHLARAHFHEYLLCHSIRSGYKPGSLAKIAAQVVQDYDFASTYASKLILSDPLREFLGKVSYDKIWRHVIDFKLAYFRIVMNLLSAFEYSDEKVKEVGFRIGRLRAAQVHAQKCRNVGFSELNQSAKEAFEVIEKMIVKKMERAVRYNDNIYHAQVPSGESMPVIEAKVLASPASFNVSNVPDFKDLFSNLVTIEAVQVNSIYSQKKDDLTREIKASVGEKDEQLAHLMSTLNLNRTSLKPQPLETPDELMEICAALSLTPNIVDDTLNKLSNLDEKIEQVQNILARCETLVRRLPVSKSLGPQQELGRLKTTHEEALKVTSMLHKQLTPEVQSNIRALAGASDPSSLLPQNQTKVLDQELANRISSLLSQVDDLKRQRAKLLAEFFHSIDKDDVLNHIVVASSHDELNSVFDTEIQKHNKFLNPLRDNLKEQDQLLDRLEKSNAEFGEVKLSFLSQRKEFLEKLDAYKKSYSQFNELQRGIEQGMTYSRDMYMRVNHFLQSLNASKDLSDFTG